MIKSIKEKMNKVTINENVETLAAVERERERISLFNVKFVCLTYIKYCFLKNIKTHLNDAEILNKNIKFNKGRTMPTFNRGIDLSFGAFWKELRNLKNKKYLITYKKVRAGP